MLRKKSFLGYTTAHASEVAGHMSQPKMIPHGVRCGRRARALPGCGHSCYASFMSGIVLPLAEIAPLLPPRGALIGLDLGTKTIGVAASDPDRRLANGVETVRRRTFSLDCARLIALAHERKVVGMVLGLPINMNGSEGPRAQSTRAFARNLAKLCGMPIGLWDERLSTAAAERGLLAADASRRKRAAVIDQHAAAYILQGALDRLAAIRAAGS